MEKGLPILAEVREKSGCLALADVRSAEQCAPVGEVVDILQIPAFLCRQTDILLAAAKTGKAVNVKKGQFLAPWDMANVVRKIEEGGNRNVLVTERGASFGYNTLISDMRALPILARTGCPIVFDATHSVQQPGGQGTSSGGERGFVPVLALIARGRSNKLIARELGISEKTVKTHVSNILSKLHLEDRTQLAIYALKEGLVDQD